MTKWNYRVVLKDGVYGIHEAYYSKTDEITSIITNPVDNLYIDYETLDTGLKLMLLATTKPTIDFETMKEI